MKNRKGQISLTLVWALIVAIAVISYWSSRIEMQFSYSGLLLTGADFLRFEPKFVPESLGYPKQQPIQFPHSRHVMDNGIECETCHTTVRTETYATIPNVDTCMMCHSSPLTEEIDEEDKIREYAARGEQIPWEMLNRLPPHVYFSHARHVTAGRLACENCMGDMGSQPAPPEIALKKIRMEFCLNCHLKTGQTQDCLLCHR